MQQSKSRLEAISDAIFAFAATLVVVSLDIPDNFADLRENLTGFFSFAVSFFAIMGIWWTHHNFFRRSDYVDLVVVGLNMAMVFVVLFYVYPLKFLANLAFGQGTIQDREEMLELFILYSFGFGAIFFFLSLMYFYVARKQARKELNFWGRHFSLFVAAALLSILLAWLGIGIRYGLPGFVYMLLGPACGLHGWLSDVKEDTQG
ncbi:MAG: TMEM175 family protein [Bacteroidota bacterium]